MEAIASALSYDHAAIIGELWPAPTDLAARPSKPSREEHSLAPLHSAQWLSCGSGMSAVTVSCLMPSGSANALRAA